MKNPNWEKIKTEYITGSISIREICKKYDLNKRTAARSCSNEKWVEQRKKHRDKVVRKAVQKMESPKAKALAQNLARVDRMNAIVDKFLDSELYNKHFVEIGEGKGVYHTEEVEFKKPDTKSIRDMATTIEKMANVSLVLTNFINERDRIMLDLAQQRLEIDKLRLELDRQKDPSEGKDITITIADEVKDWAK